MENCASEDTTNKGSGIRQEKIRNNPNEADVVIDTNPVLTPKKEVEESVEDTISSPVNTNASASADEMIPFPKNGIKLSHLLNEFVDECGGREALEGLTTTDVCDKFVKPKTKKYGLSYCDMILEKAKTNSKLDGVVKTATVFISHAWQYKFLDVLSALEDHFKDEPDKIVWFDLVSNNQHKAEAGELPYEEWATTFKDAIGQIGHTVMVMAPWNDPIPYKRAWCIFEVYCTSVTDAKFEIAMSNNEHQAFIDEWKSGPRDIINKMLSIVNAEKSEASNPLDKKRIYSVIKNEVGFVQMDLMVFKQLRDWVLVVALVELSKVDINTDDETLLKYLIGALYEDQGKYDEAEQLYKECLAKREMILGSNHPDTLGSMESLAFLYENQCKYDEAEQLYKECLTKRKMVLGLDHPDTLQLMESLAFLYENQCKYDKAEPLYKECLTKRKMVLGLDHPDTLQLMESLAVLYDSQGKDDQAERLYKECLANCEALLGSNHSHTLQSMTNLAGFYRFQGRYDEAEQLYKECLAKTEAILGSNHSDTLGSMHTLAGFYEDQCRYDEAEQLYKECQAKTEAILGSNHRATLGSMKSLARLYVTQGKYDKAEPLYKECLAKQKTILGPDHLYTLQSMKSLAGLYDSQGKYYEAEQLYKKCLVKCEGSLGHQDFLTIAIRENLEHLQNKKAL